MSRRRRPQGVLQSEPVLAVCGFSGSGKTTLLESVVGELSRRGLSVGVVKHDAHGIQIDRPGKDSDRLFLPARPGGDGMAAA